MEEVEHLLHNVEKEKISNSAGLKEDSNVTKDILAILSDACPVVVSGSFAVLFNVVTNACVGHAGPNDLAAAGFGSMFCNLSGNSIIVGIASGLETVASQLFGAGEYRHVGIALQRTIYVTTLVSIPLAVLWMCSGFFMPFLIDASVATLSSQFVHIMCAGMLPYIIKESFEFYLNAQGLFMPIVYSYVVTFALFVPACWLLVIYCHLGSSGAAAALAGANVVELVIMVAFVRWRRLHVATWPGWTREALSGGGAYLRVALPACGMMCLEWWCFEIVTLASGRLGTTAVAAQSVMFTTNSLAFVVGFGFAVAASMRTGNHLGAGRPAAARRNALLAWVTMVAIAAAFGALLFALGRQWAGLFTADAAVIDAMTGVVHIQALLILFDSSNAVLSGVLRGCGQQAVGLFICVVAFYALALPLGLTLAFHYGMGLRGLWFPIFISLSLSACLHLSLPVHTPSHFNSHPHSDFFSLGLTGGREGAHQLVEAASPHRTQGQHAYGGFPAGQSMLPRELVSFDPHSVAAALASWGELIAGAGGRIGLVSGSAAQCLGLSAYVLTTDWEGLAARARVRVQTFSNGGDAAPAPAEPAWARAGEAQGGNCDGGEVSGLGKTAGERAVGRDDVLVMVQADVPAAPMAAAPLATTMSTARPVTAASMSVMTAAEHRGWLL